MDERSPPNPYAPPILEEPAPPPPEMPRDPGDPDTISEGGHWALIPLYLLFKPGFFFRRYGAACPVGVGIFVLWVFGIAATIDRIDLRTATGSGQFSQLGVLDSWGTYWGFVLGGSICATGGIAFFRVGWYWLRLVMSGVKGPQYGVALNLYAFSSLINATPTLVAAVVSSIVYDTPRGMQYAADTWWIIVAVFALTSLFWSTWTSYRGVRAVYQPRVWSARMWFLIFPWTVQTIAAGVMIGLGVFLSTSTPPDLDAPVAHEGDVFEVEYPANWEMDAEFESMDAGGMVTITPIYQDAFIKFQAYEPTDTLENELNIAADTFADQTEFTITAQEDLDRIGPWEGVGRRYEARHPEGVYVYDVLCARVTEWYNVDISMVYLPGDEPVLRPGFDHALESVQIKTPDRVPADLANGYYVTSGSYRVLIPGNWTWEESASGGSSPGESVRRLDVYPHAAGVLRLMEYQWGGTAEEAVEETIEFRVGSGEELTRAPFGAWGPLAGAGAVVRYRLEDGKSYKLSVVVQEIGEGRFREAHFIAGDGSSEVVDPGYTFIERTLEVD